MTSVARFALSALAVGWFADRYLYSICRITYSNPATPTATLPLLICSLAVNNEAPTAAGISNVGAGPMAIASAGAAVAVANADTQANVDI